MTKVKTRRQLGITFRSVRLTLRELLKDPHFDREDAEAAAAAVLERLVRPYLVDSNADPRPDIDWEKIDWDAVYQFILKIVELFMTIFSMF